MSTKDFWDFFKSSAVGNICARSLRVSESSLELNIILLYLNKAQWKFKTLWLAETGLIYGALEKIKFISGTLQKSLELLGALRGLTDFSENTADF